MLGPHIKPHTDNDHEQAKKRDGCCNIEKEKDGDLYYIYASIIIQFTSELEIIWTNLATLFVNFMFWLKFRTVPMLTSETLTASTNRFSYTLQRFSLDKQISKSKSFFWGSEKRRVREVRWLTAVISESPDCLTLGLALMYFLSFTTV